MEKSSVYQIDSFKTRFREMQDAFLLAKSKHYAQWTIPYLMGEPSRDGMQQALEGDFQSVGALLTNSLSSKLAGLLFPTIQPFMDLQLNPEGRRAMEEAIESTGGDRSDLSNILSVLTSTASNKAFSGRTFFQLVLAFKYLIVTGNVAIRRFKDEDAIMCYGINSFVVRRDGLGKVVEAIIKENVYFGTLDEDVQQYVRTQGNYGDDSPELRNKSVAKYTRIYLKGNMFYEEQGIEDVILGEEFNSTYEKHRLPYIFPTWSLLNGEHYGRGLVEDLKGDFAKLSEISESLALYEIEALRVIYSVSAEAYDAIDELAEADTGSYIRVNNGAVQAIETGSAQKVQQIVADLNVVFERLARAMMWRGNTRSGDRITATEIQMEAQEVEASMGGAYSALAESLQLPISYLFLFETNEEFMNAVFDLDVGQVQISTGINALGKTTKAQNIIQALMEAGQLVEIVQFDKRIDFTRIVDVFFEARGIDFKEISKTPEQMEEEARAEAEQAQSEATMQEAQMMGQMGNEMGGV